MTTLPRTSAPILAIFVLTLLPACTTQIIGVPPSLEKKFIDHPAESRIYFRDDEASHVITLLEDGIYEFASGDPYGLESSARRGHWSWRSEGSHKAELTLDDNTWILTFASPDSAVAVNTAAPGRTFAFQFEKRNEAFRGNPRPAEGIITSAAFRSSVASRYPTIAAPKPSCMMWSHLMPFALIQVAGATISKPRGSTEPLPLASERCHLRREPGTVADSALISGCA
jgi:hypothetical protein